MKKLKLTRGLEIKVDDETHDALHYWNWQTHILSNVEYSLASRTLKINGKRIALWLHRLIADAPEGWTVKFINSNRLDCQAHNLRAISLASLEYEVKPFTGKTRRLGVKWNSYYGVWESYLDRLHVGYHRTTIEAAYVYNNALRHIKGKNFEPNRGLPHYRICKTEMAPYYEGEFPRGR